MNTLNDMCWALLRSENGWMCIIEYAQIRSWEGTRSVCEVSQSLDGCLGRVRAGWSSSWQAGNWTEYGVIYKVMLKRLKILGV